MGLTPIRIAPAVLSIATSQLQLNLRGALAKPRARFCSCPPSHSYSSPSRSTLVGLSIPALGFRTGFVHHATCALSSNPDNQLCSSLFSNNDDDDYAECIFNKNPKGDSSSDIFDDDEDYEKHARKSSSSFDSESLSLPCTPLAAHLYEPSRTASLPHFVI